jgi:hypothetical protein
VVAVAAAAVVFTVWMGGRGPSSEPGQVDPVLAASTALPPSEAGTESIGLRAEEVDDLDGAELDALLARLGPEAVLPDDELSTDDEYAAPTPDDVSLELFEEWVVAEADGASATTELDLFDTPDYGALIDDLTEAEIDALDAYLAAQTG